MNYQIHKKGNNQLHWQIIIIIAIIVFIIGLISNILAYPTTNTIEILNNLLRTIQLFQLQQDLEVPEGAWYLTSAKILGTIVAFMIISQVIFQIFINQIQIWQLQKKRNHILILGFGQSGQQFALSALAQHKQVIAIDTDISEQQQAFIMQNNNISLLLADSTDKATLLQAAAHQAERIIFASEDDLQNIQAVNSLRQILQQQNKKQVHIQIDEPPMIEILKQYPNFIKEDDKLKLTSFNRHKLAARRLLLSYPLYQYADLRGQDRVTVAIFGFSHQAQQLLLQLALNSNYRDFKQPHIIICDKQATKQGQQFLNNNSGLKDQQICKLDFIDFDIDTQQIEDLLQKLEKQGKSAYNQNITAIIISYEQQSQNLTASLQLRIKTQQTRLALAPIFVSMTQDIKELSVSIEQTPHFDQVVQHFGQLEQTCNWQQIVETSSDNLAEFLHNEYNKHYGTHKKWSELTESYRDANRTVADHLPVKLASLEYNIPKDPSNWSQQVDLTENLELMAELEHNRWYAERKLNGWQYGETRNDNHKIHPCLVPYEQLPEQEKQKDRENIQALQQFFSSKPKQSGEKVRKNINIAILATKEFQQKEIITNILEKYKENHITLITALQNKQEQQLAEIAIQQGAKLIIPSPYPSEQEIKAEWIIDLLPAGKQPTSLTEQEKQIQQQRAVIYQLERADIVIMIGENPQWIRWRQGKEKIPAELSSIPASLNREIPREMIVV
jgi:hypothetical protein